MPKTKTVRISTPDSELEFAVAMNTKGKDIFKKVVDTVQLKESWFFGLEFTDSKGNKEWLKLSKAFGGHDICKEDPLNLRLKIKFYPEAAEEELVDDIALKYFYLELKRDILTGEIYCPPATCVLLASYACQVKYEDFDESVRFGVDKTVLPERVLEQHNLSQNEWKEKIVEIWKTYQDMLREDAMLEYIKIVQDLEMYGVNYFDIKNRKGTDLLLGVDALGLNVYEMQNKLSPKIGFPWSEIRNISFNDKKFMIKPIDKKAPDFIFFTNRLRVNKRILSLCMGYHELYIKRRQSDSLEVLQLKERAKEVKEAKNAEKQKRINLRNEKEAMAEKNRRLKEEMDEIKLRHQEAQESLLRKQEEKEESDRKVRELEDVRAAQQEEMMRLDERRSTLERDIEQQREDYAIRSAEDNERINEQLRQMQTEKEELQQRIHITKMEQKQQQEQFELREREHEYEKRHGLVRLYNQYSIDDEEQAASVDMTQQANIQNDKSEEERQTYISGSEQHSHVITGLVGELQQHQKDDKLTESDVIHKRNQAEGRDKYKTLKTVRKGNTRMRVDMFEAE